MFSWKIMRRPPTSAHIIQRRHSLGGPYVSLTSKNTHSRTRIPEVLFVVVVVSVCLELFRIPHIIYPFDMLCI